MSAENISYDLKRFAGIKRDYTPEEVERLRGSIKIEYSMCKHQSIKLWNLLNSENYVNTLRFSYQETMQCNMLKQV
jgi:isocitrate lyase